jgi:hypothetical protein
MGSFFRPVYHETVVFLFLENAFPVNINKGNHRKQCFSTSSYVRSPLTVAHPPIGCRQ